MKDFKNDSTSVLTRFGRDKRQRTVTATAERVERRPRLQRDAADSEQPSDDRKPVKRASYNPHFTEDNRPAFDKPRRSFGDERQGDRARSDERYRDGDKPRRSFGDKPRGENPPTATTGVPRNSATASPATNPPATVGSQTKSPVTAGSATNPTESVNPATSPPATVGSRTKSPAIVGSATNPISPDSGSTTTSRLPIRSSHPKSRSAKCA